MHKRILFFALVLVLAVTSLTPLAKEENTVVAQSPELVIWADDTRAPALEELGAQFTEEFGVTVTIQEVGFGDIRNNFKTAAPAGEGPDIIIGAHDWLGELVEGGLLEPMDLGDKAELFLPNTVAAFTYEGVLYGMPYALENVAFVYNPELVEEAPETWEDVMALSMEIQESGAAEYGYVERENDPYHFYGVQTAFGGYVFGLNEDGSYNVEDLGVNSEGSIAAYDYLATMVEDGLIPPGLDYDGVHGLFEAGDAAMIITGPWAIERIEASGIPFAVAALPSAEAPGAPFMGVQGFMINAFSENKELAAAFLLEFVATDEAMQALFEAGDRPSAFVAVNEAIEDPILLGFAEAGANAQAMPNIPEMNSVWSAWGIAMQNVVQGAESPEDAANNAAEAIMTALEGGE